MIRFESGSGLYAQPLRAFRNPVLQVDQRGCHKDTLARFHVDLQRTFFPHEPSFWRFSSALFELAVVASASFFLLIDIKKAAQGGSLVDNPKVACYYA